MERFFEKYSRNEVTLDSLDDFIESWHLDVSGVDLYDYLGIKKEEYILWVGNDYYSLELKLRERIRNLKLDLMLNSDKEK